MGVDYKVKPYSGAQWARNEGRQRIHGSSWSTKVPGGVSVRHTFGNIVSMFDFDPDVRSAAAMPMKLEMAIEGRKANFIPDFVVEMTDDSLVYIFIDDGKSVDPEALQAAVSIFKEKGWRLLVVRPDIVQSNVVDVAHQVTGWAHKRTCPPEMLQDIRTYFEDAGTVEFDDLLDHLRTVGWPERHRQSMHTLNDLGVGNLDESTASGAVKHLVCAAILKGDLDIDPQKPFPHGMPVSLGLKNYGGRSLLAECVRYASGGAGLQEIKKSLRRAPGLAEPQRKQPAP